MTTMQFTDDGNPQHPAGDGKKSKGSYKLVSTDLKNTAQQRDSILQSDPIGVEALIEFTFKIDGMTCVACSSSIERLMHNTFDAKGMAGVAIVLLTHKMVASFPQEVFNQKMVTPQIVCDTVEMIGFGCELLSMMEISQEARRAVGQDGQAISESDLDSVRIRGDDQSIDEEPRSPGKIDFEIENENSNPPQGSSSRNKQVSVQIKMARIEIDESTGCLSSQDCAKIAECLCKLEGVVDCSGKTNVLPNVVHVSYRINGTPLRDIIEQIKQLGYTSARYAPEQDENSLRQILEKEVKKYRRKFLSALVIEVPILILTWIIPYSNPDFLIENVVVNGMPLYIFLMLGLSGIIQFWLGAGFYKGAYKAVRGGSANMDVLVVLGTSAAWFYGLGLIFIGDHAFGTSHSETMEEHSRHSVHEHAHNFEIAATLISVILFGKFLESVTKKQTVDKLSQLASLKVSKALLMEAGAQLSSQGKETDVDLLVIGDIIKVINGQTMPIDGVVVAGDGLVNESMLTGEAKPVNKDLSSKVYGGTMLLRGALLVKVDRLAEQSAINQIMKLVESAQSAKAPIQGIADKIAQYFVPTIVLLAVISWCVWFSLAYSDWGETHLWLGGQTRFVFAFNFGVSTLVIACPCALGLATPTAVMVGTGIAASFGCLIKGGDVLERINGITTVVFDKTGTLTAGSPYVKDLIDVMEKFKPARLEQQDGVALSENEKFNFEELLTMLYLCEASSEHPLAKAMVSRVKKEYAAVESDTKFKLGKFKNINGEGVVVKVVQTPETADSPSKIGEIVSNEEGSEPRIQQEEGQVLEVLCGNDKLMSRYGVDLDFNDFRMNMQSLEKEGKTVVCLVINNKPRLLISLEEAHLAKEEALGVVTYLRNVMKMRVAMITGDNEHAAMKVARYLDIPSQNVTFRAYPNDKKRVVKKFQAAGEKVMFIGDGVNDSPVLAQADVGVAINSASDITVQAAGIVAMKDRLDDVLNAILISKSTFWRIKINFAWAFVYNIVLVPIAMGLFYPIGAHRGSDDVESEFYDQGRKGLQLDPMWAGMAMALSSVSVVLSSLMLKLFKYKDMQTLQRKAQIKGSNVEMEMGQL